MKHSLKLLVVSIALCASAVRVSAGDTSGKTVGAVTRDKCIQSLTKISSHPTAPFYEYWMSAYIQSELKRLGLAVRQDKYGNIISEYAGPKAPKQGTALVAHMDHPGFELANKEGTKAWLLGNVDKECFGKPVPVRVFPILPADGEAAQGIRGMITGVGGRLGNRVLLNLKLDGRAPALPAFGVWDLPPADARDSLTHMQAFDDNAGCATVLMALEQLVERHAPCRCYGVFTRGEEVGCAGALALAREKLLPSDTIVVSVDTTQENPQMKIGDGPVIRVGDTIMTFDRKAEMVLRVAVDAMCKENPAVKVQREFTPGVGEAFVFALEGYCTTAIAIPLGNIHNMTPEHALAPEYLSPDDIATAVEMLARSTEYVSTDNTASMRKDLDHFRPLAERLKTPFAAWDIGDDVGENAVRFKYLPPSEYNGKTDNSRMTPKQAAEAILNAMAKEDWAALRTFAGNEFDEGFHHEAYGGLKIISVGEPSQKDGYADWSVPYEVKMTNGAVRKMNLAIRNDNPRHQWEYDGGL